MFEPAMRARQAAMAQLQRAQRRIHQDLVLGPGTLYDVARLLHDQGVRCAMVVTTPGFVKRGVVPKLANDLLTHGIAAAVFSDVEHDPSIECVEQAAAFYRSRGCQAIVAIGGGSAIDCAKAAGALVARPRKSVRDLVGVLRVRAALPYFVAVPTTAGTGSEITVSAVVTDAELQRKCVINDIALIPDAAVLDANLLLDLPGYLTAGTGMDALTHAVEAYLNRFGSRVARENAEEAVGLVFANLKASYDDGRNVLYRENMLMASYQAGIAFSNATVGYVHALAHAVGARYHIAYGLACAVLLPAVLEEYGPAAEKRLARLARLVGLPGERDADLAARFIAAIRDLASSMDLPRVFDELREEDIPELAAQAEAEGNPMYPVPEIWDRPRFEKVLCAVLGQAGGGDSVQASGQAAAETPDGGQLRAEPQTPSQTPAPVENEPVIIDAPAAPRPSKRKHVAVIGTGAGAGVIAAVVAAVAFQVRRHRS